MYENAQWEQKRETVDTKKETDKKCPACGGVMDFNPATGKMLCPYCGTEEEIQVKNEKFVARELDFEEAERMTSQDWGTATKRVICKSCGAETIYDSNQIASECPYCGSNQVMEAGAENIMAPGGVVLFQINAQMAAQRFKNWIGKKFFCPKLAKDSAKPKSFKGMYIPFWTFDSRTYSTYSGEYGIDRVKKDREGKNYVVTDWYRTSGSYQEFFDDVLVCGSVMQNSGMLSGLEPYDTKKAVEYKPEYMAGFMAERYTVKMKDGWMRAKQKIQQILQGNINDEIRMRHHCNKTRNVMVHTQFSNKTCKYLLLPVWISSFQYKGKVYHFMINGQTGKVSGETPISWAKVTIVVLAVLAILAILFFMYQNGGHGMEYRW